MAKGRFVQLSLGAATVFGLIATTLPAKAEEIADKRLLAAGCFICHGPNGVAVGEVIDPLADVAPKKILVAMKKYKDDQRQGTIMNRIAKGYSDEELEALVEFIGEHAGEPMVAK